MRFLFKTTTTMKEYNAKKWWILSDIVRNIEIDANTINEAVKQYAEIVKENTCIDISKNAIKRKAPMYVDKIDGTAKQIGYVITGKYPFDDYHNHWTDQYIDLWVSVSIMQDAFAA